MQKQLNSQQESLRDLSNQLAEFENDLSKKSGGLLSGDSANLEPGVPQAEVEEEEEEKKEEVKKQPAEA
eukprot:CAMPEP_0170548946 /NCGR_PEP_ID=MMETSP0211-20121228/7124_1 /TAXON_ID=311385 /ORGANISM="Pseudokeronopsis sp., Strain OXSARD2" /LENGTH=68 /DNA_ID=CAMNT_0010854677 /DNA_START=46 /DNA_END=252 /DNA_ORIENTATION=-